MRPCASTLAWLLCSCLSAGCGTPGAYPVLVQSPYAPDLFGKTIGSALATEQAACSDQDVSVLPLFADDLNLGPATKPKDLSAADAGDINAAMELAAIKARINILPPAIIKFKHAMNSKDEVHSLMKAGNTPGSAIHKARETAKADVVVLYTTVNDICGTVPDIVLTRNVAKPNEAYVVLSPRKPSCTFTFAHELGHIFGQRHHDDTSPSALPLAHGFCEAKGSFGTIMANPETCKAPRLRQWSDPNKKSADKAGKLVPTGDKTRSHVAAVLPTTLKTAARFRCST